MSFALTSLFDRWKDKFSTPLLQSILDQFDCKCLWRRTRIQGRNGVLHAC